MEGDQEHFRRNFGILHRRMSLGHATGPRPISLSSPEGAARLPGRMRRDWYAFPLSMAPLSSIGSCCVGRTQRLGQPPIGLSRGRPWGPAEGPGRMARSV